MRHLSARPRLRTSAMACAAVVVALVATACGASSSDTGSSQTPTDSGGSSTAVSAAQAELAKYSEATTTYPDVSKVDGVAALKGKSVWYVPFGSAVPILAAYGDAMKEALAAAGVELHVCDGKFLPTEITSCLSQAVTQGADAVVTGYVDYTLVPTAFDNLVSHNIPVLLAGTSPQAGKTSDAKLAFFDAMPTLELEGKLSVDAIVADSGGTAKILYVGVAEPDQLVQASAAIKDNVSTNCPGCSLTAIDYIATGIQKLPSQVSAALIANPDVNYVLTEVDAAAGPAISGIQAANRSGDIKVVSANGQLDALQRLAAGGDQTVDVGASPAYDGWSFADGIVRMMTGSAPEQRVGLVRVFTPDNVSGLTLTPAAYVTNDWYGSDAYKQGFKTAWGIQ